MSLSTEATVAPVLEVVEAGVVGRLEDHVHSAEPWPVHPLTCSTQLPP